MTLGIARPLPEGLVSPRQEDLLRVIYGPSDGVAERFRDWERGLDLTDLDDGCYRLYPQLYRCIRGFAPDHHFLARMKGTFRRTYYRNQLLFRWGLEVVDRLAEAGIGCLVLKGASLVPSTGISSGLRPMADIDLLVRLADAERALTVAGPLFTRFLADPERTHAHLMLRHGYTALDRNRLEIDLHWRIADVWQPGDDFDAPFWATAERLELQGRPIRVLAPTELLFHLVAHGIPRNPVPGIRWISDSLELLATEGHRIDWPRLARLAHRVRRALLVQRGLEYLAATFGAAVPTDALAAFDGADAAEAAEFDILTRGWSAPEHLGAARPVVANMLPVLAERLPGRRLVLYMTDACLRHPGLADWARALGADVVCEFAPTSPMAAAIRARVGDGPGDRAVLHCFETSAGALPARHVHAYQRPPGDRRAGLRVFCTTLTDWPRGAIVLRLDRSRRLLVPNLVGPDQTIPTPLFPFGPGLFAAAGFRPG